MTVRFMFVTMPCPHQVTPSNTVFHLYWEKVFALGLLVNSNDIFDLQYVITTSENPDLSAKCVTKHLDLSNHGQIAVGVGTPFPDYSLRGGICAIPDLIGFALEAECQNVTLPYSDTGIEDVAALLMESNRTDWWYIVVGGQSSLRTLVEEYPEAMKKVDTLMVMGGNWCGGYEPYPDVLAPTDETNIACDPAAANVVLNNDVVKFKNVYFTPVEAADEIGGTDYGRFVTAAESSASLSATATLDFYKAWSVAGRADPSLLIHLEALAYDPETESTPQFDPCAIMFGIELLTMNETCDELSAIYDFEAVHFLEAGEGVSFPDSPRSGFSLYTGEDLGALPTDQCPYLTNYTFDPAETIEEEAPVKITLGYTSPEAKARFFANMATRMAGGVVPTFVYFLLYDAKNDTFVEPIYDGSVISSPPCEVNIEAVIPCGTEDYVRIELLQNSTRVKKQREGIHPYFLYGNRGTYLRSGTIPAGTYTLTAKTNDVKSQPIMFTLGECA